MCQLSSDTDNKLPHFSTQLAIPAKDAVNSPYQKAQYGCFQGNFLSAFSNRWEALFMMKILPKLLVNSINHQLM